MKISISDFLLDLTLRYKDIKFDFLTEYKGEINFISNDYIENISLPLNGFYNKYHSGAIVLVSEAEFEYINYLYKVKKDVENLINNLKKFFSFDIPLICFTNDNKPENFFINLAEEFKIPILVFKNKEYEITRYLITFLEDIFAPFTVVHGDFVEVFGIGVLITGESGIGKSETALELIQRGHRLISDDYVEIKRMSGNFLFGKSSKIVSHFIEIRGVGIVDISRLYGVGAIREKKKVELIVHLEEWSKDKVYDRAGMINKTKNILGIDIPYILIPVKPGRNIPSIIETAAMNYRLKRLGINSAIEFNEKILKWMRNEKKIDPFYD